MTYAGMLLFRALECSSWEGQWKPLSLQLRNTLLDFTKKNVLEEIGSAWAVGLEGEGGGVVGSKWRYHIVEKYFDWLWGCNFLFISLGEKCKCKRKSICSFFFFFYYSSLSKFLFMGFFKCMLGKKTKYFLGNNLNIFEIP